MINPKDMELSFDGSPWVKIDMTRSSHNQELSLDGSSWLGFFISYIHSPEYTGGFDNTNGGFDD